MWLILCVSLFSVSTSLMAEDIPIFTIDQLQKIGRDPNYPLHGNYYLANDIDATDTKFWNNGEGFRPIGRRDPDYFSGFMGWIRKQVRSKVQEFEGTFDGKGYKITNLHIVPNKEEADLMGIFAWIGEKGCVKNLNIENISMEDNDSLEWSCMGPVTGTNEGIIENVHTSGKLSGLSYIGGIAGRNFNMIKRCSSSCNIEGWFSIGGISGTNDGSITFSFFSGTVTDKALHPNFVREGEYMGGITGYHGYGGGEISYCYSIGSVEGTENIGGLIGMNRGITYNCYATGSVRGQKVVGGFVGDNAGEITNCYATGNVRGKEGVGGFVGQNVADDRALKSTGKIFYGNVKNCYSTGKVEGEIDIGGFVGINKPSCMVISCFWDKETSTMDLSTGGTGKTTIEMKQQKTFEEEAWNFEDIWRIEEGKSYPFLVWEKEGSNNCDKTVQ